MHVNHYPVFLLAIGLRTTLVAVILVAGLRLAGKRRLAQLNIYDLALIMGAGNAVQNAMTQGSGRLLAGLVSAGVLIGLSALAGRLFVRSAKIQQQIVGSPTLLLNDGHQLRDRMHREGVTEQELLHAARLHGIGDLKDVLMATLEIDGEISIVPKTAEHTRIAKALPPAV